MGKLIGCAEVVELSGPDAESFAQSQFSNEVAALPVNSWHWNAWLDPQGRVRFLFALLHPQPGHLVAWLPLGNASDMARELTRFIFRSRLKIQARPEACLLEIPMVEKAGQTMNTSDDGWSIDLPALPPRQVTISLQRPESTADSLRHLEWQLADIAAGLPWVAAELSGEFTAPALGLERIAAVSLTKGCYPGQEIIARLHYRGGNKRHCVRLSIEGDCVPASGEVIHGHLSDAPAGRILYAARSPQKGIQALAVLSAGLIDVTGLRLDSGNRIADLEKA